MSSAIIRSVTIVVVFCIAGLQAHSQCGSDRVLLRNTVYPDECATECIDANHEGKDCFAWEYNAETEKCHGYILTDDPPYDSEYSVCGIVEGAYISYIPGTDEEAPASVVAEEGCEIRDIALGISRDPEECKNRCETLLSNIYGGCAAWLWHEDSENCTGMLSRRSGRTTCGAA